MTQKSVLFFGRSNCEATLKCIARLEALGFDSQTVISTGRGQKMPEFVKNWTGDYILCFRSLFILRKPLLERAAIAAVNFHPAPAEYPGSGCINFALYDEADLYGVTAHIMNDKVDNGAILECRRFPIEEQDNLDSLLAKTHAALLQQFLDFIEQLAATGVAFLEAQKTLSEDEQWSGKARRMKELDALQIISPDATEDHVRRVIRATYTKRFPPKVMLHSYEFILTDPTPKSS